MQKNYVRNIFIVSLFGTAILTAAVTKYMESKSNLNVMNHISAITSSEINKDTLSQQLGPALKSNSLPDQMDFERNGTKQKVSLHYTIDPFLQAYMQKLLKSYSPDYGAFVALDPQTGKVLSMLSFRNASDPRASA